MGQFNLLNNMGVLQDESTQDAGRGFGSNRFYNYQLKDNILKERDEFLPSYYVAMPSNFGSVGKLD
jgi:hypothetical protein